MTYSHLSILELMGLFRGYMTMREAAIALVNAPNYRNSDGEFFLDAEFERINDILSDIATEARRRDTSDDPNLRSELLVRWAIECDDWAEAASVAAQFVAPSHAHAGGALRQA